MRFFSIRDFWSSFRVEADTWKRRKSRSCDTGKAAPPPRKARKHCRVKVSAERDPRGRTDRLLTSTPTLHTPALRSKGRLTSWPALKRQENFVFLNYKSLSYCKSHKRYECLHIAQVLPNVSHNYSSNFKKLQVAE